MGFRISRGGGGKEEKNNVKEKEKKKKKKGSPFSSCLDWGKKEGGTPLLYLPLPGKRGEKKRKKRNGPALPHLSHGGEKKKKNGSCWVATQKRGGEKGGGPSPRLPLKALLKEKRETSSVDKKEEKGCRPSIKRGGEKRRGKGTGRWFSPRKKFGPGWTKKKRKKPPVSFRFEKRGKKGTSSHREKR